MLSLSYHLVYGGSNNYLIPCWFCRFVMFSLKGPFSKFPRTFVSFWGTLHGWQLSASVDHGLFYGLRPASWSPEQWLCLAHWTDDDTEPFLCRSSHKATRAVPSTSEVVGNGLWLIHLKTNFDILPDVCVCVCDEFVSVVMSWEDWKQPLCKTKKKNGMWDMEHEHGSSVGPTLLFEIIIFFLMCFLWASFRLFLSEQ